MNRLLALLVFLTATMGLAAEEPKSPRTDLYGDPLPPGVVMRLGTIRLRHFGAEATFSKDGKRLISLGCAGEVRTWEAATGKLLRRTRLTAKPREVEGRNRVGQPEELSGFLSVVLSSSGETVAGWMEQDLYLGDTHTGKERSVLSFDSFGGWMGPTLSPDGKWMAVQLPHIHDKSTVQIWDAVAVKKRQNLTLPLGMTLTNAVFSSDGKRLAGVVQKGDDPLKGDGIRFDLYLWDTATAQLICKREKLCVFKHFHHSNVEPLAFSPDGRTIAVGGHAEGVRLLDAASLKQKSLLKPAARISLDGFTDLAFSPDGRRLAASYSSSQWMEDGVLIWDVVSAKEERRLPAGYGRKRLAFAPDGKTLLIRDVSVAIRMWDVGSGRPLHRQLVRGSLTNLSVAPDGKIVAAADFDGQLRLWETTTGKQLRVMEGACSENGICRFSADGKRLLSLGEIRPLFKRTVINVWDVATGKKLQRYEFKNESLQINVAAISDDGRRLAMIVLEGAKQTSQLIVRDLATGATLSRRPYKSEEYDYVVPYSGKQHHSSIDHATFAPHGESVVVWLGDRLGLEDVATGSRLAALPKGLNAPLLFSPDGRLLIATLWRSGEDGRREREGKSLIEIASGEEIVRLNIKWYDPEVFTSDSRGLVVAGSDGLCIWDTTTGTRLHQMKWPESIRAADAETNLDSLAMLSGNRIATGMKEGDVLVWDLTPSTWTKSKPAQELGGKELDSLWSDLAAPARKAYAAMHTLTSTPIPAVAFLDEHLRPAKDDKHIEKLLADLDSDAFETRESASRELKRLHYRAEPMLRQALQNKPSLEMRRRIEPLLTEPRIPQAEDLRNLRAITVLERIGTPEARRILEKLGGGAPSPETRAAKAALVRLQHRSPLEKGRTLP